MSLELELWAMNSARISALEAGGVENVLTDELEATGESATTRVFESTGISLNDISKYKYAQIVLIIPSSVRLMASTTAISEMLISGYQVEASFGTDGKLCCGMQIQDGELKYFAIGWSARIVLFN